MKKFLSILILFFLLTITSVFAENSEVLPSQIGIIRSVKYVDSNNTTTETTQLAEVEIITGNFKSERILIENILTGNPYYDIKLKKGLRVLLHVESIDNELIFSIEDIQRSQILLLLSLIFCGLLVFVGRKKGINSLVSIVLTCALIINLLSPIILAGFPPILATILICLISTAITMYLVGGFNRKSSSATIGCVLSLVFAAVLSLLTVKIASLTGFANEQSMFLYSAHPELNVISITVSTMILATMGAVMDVSMSIASTINEIYSIDNSKSVKELFISGMNVGKDIIGTMANTLILVYLGSSLPLILLSSNIDLQKFINLNQVVTEISSALIGSSAIIICVPITAFVASELIKNIPEKFDFSKLKG